MKKNELLDEVRELSDKMHELKSSDISNGNLVLAPYLSIEFYKHEILDDLSKNPNINSFDDLNWWIEI